MAIIVVTSRPESLLGAIKAEINDGKIETWSIDRDGDFTHSPEQLKNRAWFYARVSEGMITFNIIGTKNEKMKKVVYGVYHGRFIEMLLNHFDLDFSEVKATALPQSLDRLGPNKSYQS